MAQARPRVMDPAATAVRFAVPDAVGDDRLVELLGERFRVSCTSARRLRAAYYDTFDWRLYGAGCCLAQEGGELRLVGLGDGAVRRRCRFGGEPRFWRDLPAGPLRELLRELLDVRALLPLFDVGMRVRALRVLNADEKTVLDARLEESELHAGRAGSKRLRTLLVQPVRGYTAQFQEFVSHLGGLGLEASAQSGFEAAAASAGLAPGAYTSRLDLALAPAMTSQRAAAMILRKLADVMAANERGIRDDIDTEFLHDFRVAVRRTRSALSQLDGVLPGAVVERFLDAFGLVARATNRLRDLDVYLLEEEKYRSLLPEHLRGGLDALFVAMAAERVREHEAFVRVLDGEYRELAAAWDGVISTLEGPGLEAENAGTPVEELARVFMLRRLRRVLRSGRRVTDRSAAGDLHALRIQCKKLRYLLEFFASVFPGDAERALVRLLRRLQDNLGESNDLAVQQRELESRLAGAAAATGVEAAAIGGLIVALHARQAEVRRGFAERFAEFAGAAERVFGNTRADR